MKSSLFIAGVTALSAFLYFENFTIETEEYNVISNKIPSEFEGFRILQISDFHCKEFGSDNKLLIDKCIASNPDIVVLTGDMISRESKSLDTFFNLAKELSVRFPVYYTIGNHELDLTDDKLKMIFSRLKKMGVTVLNNEKEEITRRGASIYLYGMWYNLRFYKNTDGSYRTHDKFTLDEITTLIGNAPTNRYSVLLAHNPLEFSVYASWGADLVFSGHVHGGVIKLPHLGGLLSPGRHFFPKYFAGEYNRGNTKMIVSRGVGGFRLFNRPNLVVATLKHLD